MSADDAAPSGGHRHAGAMLHSFICPHCDERILRHEVAWVAMPESHLGSQWRGALVVCPACERALGAVAGS